MDTLVLQIASARAVTALMAFAATQAAAAIAKHV
jgi:hypothetical protein